MKAYVKRRISAAHCLPNYDGPCRKLHGHTWLIEVWLEGTVSEKTGMLIDFRDVKSIIDSYDHLCLNDVFPLGRAPTAENFAWILYGLIPRCRKVRVWESEDAYAEMDKER